MREYARREWPGVFSRVRTEIVGGASILLEWKGSSDSRPLLLTAHQDVVPAGEGWTFDPFSGVVFDGRIHGRGTIDYKCGFAGMLEACEGLMESGFQPERTVFLAFGHDEEVGGLEGAGAITEHLLDRGIRCSSVLDEGGYVYTGAGGAETAVIAVAEKGYATFRITASAVQGHASVPPRRTAIGTLARAVTILEHTEFPDPPQPGFLKNTPLAGTTIAPTVITGGCKENVLPGTASLLVNTRPAPLSSVRKVQEHISSVLTHLEVDVELLDNPSVSEPSGFSSIETVDYENLEKAVAAVLGNNIPAVPGVFQAATDSRRYRAVAEHSYRFMPVRLKETGIAALHSVDESISIADYLNCVRFYGEFITRAAGKR